jgi:hypothetical protein
MKFQYLLILFILSLSFSAHSQVSQSDQLIIKNVDIMTWPKDISSAAVLDIYTDIINSDPETNLFFNQVNKKLQDHGISHVRDIFQYCSGESQGNAAAFFHQGANIVETRVSIPGLLEKPWSESAIAKAKAGFSSEVIKMPFIEFLAVSDRPEICIYRGEQLISAYDTLVHEMAHFLLNDPFIYLEELSSSLPFPDFVQMTVFTKGGEFDAFKIGASTGARFTKKYGLPDYSATEYKFFSADGLLTDEEGLKSYILKTYSNYYKNTDTIQQLKAAKLSIIETKLQILRNNVEPVLKTLNQDDLNKKLSDEITVLESLKSQL